MADVNALFDSIALAERSLRQRLNTAENRQIAQALDYAVQEARKAGQALGSFSTASSADKASLLGICARHLNNCAGAVNQAIGSSPELARVLTIVEQVKVASRELDSAQFDQQRPRDAVELPRTSGSAETAKAMHEYLEPVLQAFKKAGPGIPSFQREGASMVYREMEKLTARLNAVAQGGPAEWTPEETAKFWTDAQQKLRSLDDYAQRNGLSGFAPGLSVLADKASEGLEQFHQEYREQGTALPAAGTSVPEPLVNQDPQPAQEAQPRRVVARPPGRATRPLRESGEPRSASSAPSASPAAPTSPAQVLREATEALGKVHFADADSMRSLYGVSEAAAQALADAMPSIVDRLHELASGMDNARDPQETQALWEEARRALAALETGVYDNVVEVRRMQSVLRKEGGLRAVNVGVSSVARAGVYQGNYR